MSFTPVLDFLRTHFAIFVGVALPLAGVIMAIAKYTTGDREDAFRIGAASLLGICLYALLLA